MSAEPPEGIYVRAKWLRKLLSWYWSGNYWYCVLENEAGPTGCGDTKDEAFIDFKAQLKEAEKAI